MFNDGCLLHLVGSEHLDKKAKLCRAHLHHIVNELGYSPHEPVVEQALVFEERNSLHDVTEILKGGVQVSLDYFEDCGPELFDANVVLHAELQKNLALFEGGV